MSFVDDDAAGGVGAGGQDMDKMLAMAAQQLAQRNQAQLMSDMTKSCKSLCLGRPSGSLSSSEQSCLTKCVARYMDAIQVVTEQTVQSMQEDH